MNLCPEDPNISETRSVTVISKHVCYLRLAACRKVRIKACATSEKLYSVSTTNSYNNNNEKTGYFKKTKNQTNKQKKHLSPKSHSSSWTVGVLIVSIVLLCFWVCGWSMIFAQYSGTLHTVTETQMAGRLRNWTPYHTFRWGPSEV